jgi:hypothetical protein
MGELMKLLFPYLRLRLDRVAVQQTPIAILICCCLPTLLCAILRACQIRVWRSWEVAISPTLNSALSSGICRTLSQQHVRETDSSKFWPCHARRPIPYPPSIKTIRYEDNSSRRKKPRNKQYAGLMQVQTKPTECTEKRNTGERYKSVRRLLHYALPPRINPTPTLLIQGIRVLHLHTEPCTRHTHCRESTERAMPLVRCIRPNTTRSQITM